MDDGNNQLSHLSYFKLFFKYDLIILSITIPLVLIYLSLFSNTLACDNFDSLPYCFSKAENVNRLYASKTLYSVARNFSYKLSEKIRLNEQIKKCKPMMFWLFSRHTVRYPDKQEIIEINHLLTNLQRNIITLYKENKTELCFEDFQKIEKWTKRITPEDDNGTPPSGVDATKEFAENLFQMYPHLFNPHLVTFNVGVTFEQRTRDTANSFMSKIKEYYSDVTYEILELPFLYFHRECKKKIGKKIPDRPEVKEFDTKPMMTNLIKRISKRIGITLSLKDVILLYRTCSYEFAIYDDSPWCALLDQKELETLEFREDVEDYFNDAYGYKINRKMPCPLIKDLVQKIKYNLKEKKPITSIYFSHAGAIKRLFASFKLFDKLKLDYNFCPDKKRNWQSSIICPFNSNFLAILYDCKHKNEDEDEDEIDLEDIDNYERKLKHYKILTQVQNEYVKVNGCKSAFCKLTDFLDKYQSKAENCDLDKICSFDNLQK